MAFNTTYMLKVCSISLLALGGFAVAATTVAPTAVMAGNGNGGGNGGGNGSNGGGHGNSGADHGNSSGASHDNTKSDKSASSKTGKSKSPSVHSELKGLNAAHASATAMTHANPKSQVGRISAYKDAAVSAGVSYQSWQDAVAAYEAFEGSYAGPSAADVQSQIDAAEVTNGSLQGQIDALDPASTTYDDDKAALEAQMVDKASLQANLEIAQAYETMLGSLETAASDAETTYTTAISTEQATLDTATGGRQLSAAALAELRSMLGL